jgi:TonB-dependent starch-binding outer membrane protein SusC
MALVRYVVPALLGGLLWAAPLSAQDPSGTITGRVLDAVGQQPLAGVSVRIEGTRREAVTRMDGRFVLTDVAAGTHRLRATRIGYAPVEQDVTVTVGAPAEVNFTMQPQAALIEPVVVTGYGAQRREAVTGSVATIDPAAADVGVLSNVNQMLQGRAAGVQIIQNNGEPGAGVQIRIRGGTSISASNEPLYVIDGVPIANKEPEARGIGVGGDPPLPRSPLNLLNPSDIASITILKDASATAIYGSRGANGVVLIETNKGTAGAGGGTTVAYDSYVATASAARSYDLLTGAEYRQFVEGQVALWVADSAAGVPLADRDGLASSYLGALGPANTDWEREIMRSSVTHNHNLSFAGGSDVTRYRASLNYMDQQGVALGNGLQRIQGRLSGTHSTWGNRLRLGLNVTSSRVDNDYLSFDNTGGFQGGVFFNMVSFNPTQPVRDSTGAYNDVPTATVWNPVALAEQIADVGTSTRILANATAELDLVPGLTGSVNVGVDQSDGIRRTYLPAASPAGANFNGRARQVNRENSSVTFQGQLNYRTQFADVHSLDVVGAYEFAEHSEQELGAEGRNFTTDKFSFNNLGSGSTLFAPWSFRNDERWISFLSRASYGLKGRYYLTGVLRYDGRSAFAEGHKWSLFPGLSGSWRISGEDFMRDAPLGLTDLRLRAGWGVVGNPGIDPYDSQLLIDATGRERYVFGDTRVTGFGPARNPNPNLKFERTSQVNVAVDYALMNNRVSGSIEYYVKNTSDLLLEVTVAQPAFAPTRLENVGRVRNRGLELALDVLAMSRPGRTWRAGVVLAAERNTVLDLGPFPLILSGIGSGEGQTSLPSQRIIPGEPLGTFWGPVYTGVDAQGRQLIACSPLGIPSDTLCINGRILATDRRDGDSRVIGNANPDFTVGFTSQVTWGKFDASLLIRGAFGQEVFNNTALVYGTKTKAAQQRNFLASALDDEIAIGEPAIFSSKWVEDGSFVRLQNLTVGYTFDIARGIGAARTARLYVSSDNLLLLTGYSGVDPEVHSESGIASRGIDYLTYPRPRTVTAGVRVAF